MRDIGRIHAEVLRDLDEHRAVTETDPKEKGRLRDAADLNLDGLRRCG